ncbi:hypothetical protein BGZ63DRAFT_399708 [Mariannaea sp. PMI_226]|nr:hypothetical protein BGZ63DRAFT_399708 [Mariannaea sp. PMI_226]
MCTDLEIDLNLPSAENHPTPTPFRSMFQSTEGLYGIDPTTLDSVVGFSTPPGPSTSDRALDCSLSELLGECFPDPMGPPTPHRRIQADAPSLLHSHPTHSRGQPDMIAREKKSSHKRLLNESGTNDVGRNTKANSNQRPHYAVESRYRSTLNEKYAALTQALLSEAVQRICRTEAADWVARIDSGAPSNLRGERGTGNGNRQQKTTTLSATIDTINTLSRCCAREARDVEQLRQSVRETRTRVQQILEAKSS